VQPGAEQRGRRRRTLHTIALPPLNKTGTRTGTYTGFARAAPVFFSFRSVENG
jgi:hypothetical protein